MLAAPALLCLSLAVAACVVASTASPAPVRVSAVRAVFSMSVAPILYSPVCLHACLPLVSSNHLVPPSPTTTGSAAMRQLLPRAVRVSASLGSARSLKESSITQGGFVLKPPDSSGDRLAAAAPLSHGWSDPEWIRAKQDTAAQLNDVPTSFSRFRKQYGRLYGTEEKVSSARTSHNLIMWVCPCLLNNGGMDDR